MTNTMKQTESVAGGLAECFITIDDNRYNFMQFTHFESSYKPKVIDVPILGRTTIGKKMVGGTGTFTGKAHYNQSIIRKVMLNYHKNGTFTPFEIQVTNEDPATSIGMQTIILSGCLLDSVTLAKFSAGEDLLEEEISGTFDKWDMPQEFDNIDGMM